MKIDKIGYSIGYTVFDAASAQAILKLSNDGGLARQALYQSVTLSPTAAPPIAAAPANAIPRFDDDFFEFAFEGLTEALPLATAPVTDRWGAPAPGALNGFLEDCSPERIAGWAQDPHSGGAPVTVAIMLGRIVLATVIADGWRADLSAASIGTGHHAFEFQPVPAIARDFLGAVRVVRVADKAELPRVFDLINQ